MKIQILTLTLLLSLIITTGCMKLEGYKVLSKSSGIDGAFKDNQLIIGIFHQGWPRQYEIDKTRSFLISPSGDKSQITTEVHDERYADSAKSPYLKIYRLDNNGKKYYSWKNGVWKLKIVLKDEKTEIVEEIDIHLANMFWSPFIHGVPK